MARPVDPDPGEGGSGSPGDPGYVPPTDPSTKLAFVVASSNVTITSDQISGAGGPWPSFKMRVTPFNSTGNGTAATADYPPPAS